MNNPKKNSYGKLLKKVIAQAEKPSVWFTVAEVSVYMSTSMDNSWAVSGSDLCLNPIDTLYLYTSTHGMSSLIILCMVLQHALPGI